MKVDLVYFNELGRFKYDGSYESERDNMTEVFEEVEGMIRSGSLPKIAGTWGGPIYVDSEDGYPRLLNLE